MHQAYTYLYTRIGYLCLHMCQNLFLDLYLSYFIPSVIFPCFSYSCPEVEGNSCLLHQRAYAEKMRRVGQVQVQHYVYFEILWFLDTVCKRTASSMDGNNDEDAENDVQEGDMETKGSRRDWECPKH